MGRHVIWVGLLMGFLSLGFGFLEWQRNNPHWQTLVFTTLTFSQMAHVLAIRSERDSFFKIGPLSNKPLVGAVILTIALQLIIIYVPFLGAFFSTQALPTEEILLSIALSSLIFWAVEIEKFIMRRRDNISRNRGR